MLAVCEEEDGFIPYSREDMRTIHAAVASRAPSIILVILDQVYTRARRGPSD